MSSIKRSNSTPRAGSSPPPPPPPLTPTASLKSGGGGSNSGGKMVAIKIYLLDDSVTIIQAQSKALGRLIFDQICKQLNVLEADYFGLEYNDSEGVTYWLDLEKRLNRQVGLVLADPLLKFSVKFYTPDPSQLEEEFTRYLFSLQVKRDLSKGVLTCNDNTAALMASFIVQAECGDFSEEDYPDPSYLSNFKFVPHQNYELERKIRECHKKHCGQSPAEADLHLLETARRTEMYGVILTPARDEDGINLQLSVCHNGVLVFQNNMKINTFSWAKIRKLSFKRKRFILKLHPESFGYYKELVLFNFESRNECKSYWKRCVEHHAFFRCEKAPNPIHRSKGLLSSRGSSFRYSGKTQKQMVQFVRENFAKRPIHSEQVYLSQQNLASWDNSSNSTEKFQRSSSFKYSPPSKNNRQQKFEDSSESDYHIKAQPQQQQISKTSSLTSSPNLDMEGPHSQCKSLYNSHTTLLSNLQLLQNHIPFEILTPLKSSLQNYGQILQTNLISIKKPHWELRHHAEILKRLEKHFTENIQYYKAYFSFLKENYEDLITNDETNYYAGLCCVCLCVIWWVRFVYGEFEFKILEGLMDLREELLDVCKFVEMRRDLGCNLKSKGKFLRQGVVLKLSRTKGLVARCIWVTTTTLAYGTRISSHHGFRLHGQIPTSQLSLQEQEVSGIPNSFVLIVKDENLGERMLVLAAFSKSDRDKWAGDLKLAIDSCGNREELVGVFDSSSEDVEREVVLKYCPSHRPNCVSHVCWHRNLSVGRGDILGGWESTTSSYLLRKFKNSPGWQRLWVLYANTTLYFYKSHDSSDLLASLPLLGYSISKPSEEDEIKKQNVFKLCFKNHVYFFRADSEPCFTRWVVAIKGK